MGLFTNRCQVISRDNVPNFVEPLTRWQPDSDPVWFTTNVLSFDGWDQPTLFYAIFDRVMALSMKVFLPADSWEGSHRQETGSQLAESPIILERWTRPVLIWR